MLKDPKRSLNWYGMLNSVSCIVQQVGQGLQIEWSNAVPINPVSNSIGQVHIIPDVKFFQVVGPVSTLPFERINLIHINAEVGYGEIHLVGLDILIMPQAGRQIKGRASK